MTTAEDVLDAARGEIGYSRWDDPEAGTKYGRWTAEQTGSSYYGESGVPYCAMFVSWCLGQAGYTPQFLYAYCPYIERDFTARGSKYDAQPGDLVLFDWGSDGVADHIGFVEVNNGSYVTTIEGNTSSGSSGSQSNGGCVARRTRNWSSVRAIIPLNYSNETEDDMAVTDAHTSVAGDGTEGSMQDRVDYIDMRVREIWQEVMRTDDPTGRGKEFIDHDHIKWIAAKQAEMDERQTAIEEKLDTILAKLTEE